MKRLKSALDPKHSAPAEQPCLRKRSQSGSESPRDLVQRGFQPRNFREPTLSHVLAAAPASSQARESLLHQRAHVKRLSDRLREDQSRLACSCTEKSNHRGILPSEPLRQQFDENRVP